MALSASTVLEIRQTGNDGNGGGFVTGATGTDWTLQDGSKWGTSDGAHTTGGVIFTSATAVFDATVVGNIMQIISGTNVTAGFYEVVGYTNATTITLDRDPTSGGSGSSIVFTIGGALATHGMASKIFLDHGVSGMIAYMKYSATDYAMTSTSASVAGGYFDFPAVGSYYLIGYDSDRSVDNLDDNKPQIDRTAAVASAPYVVSMALSAATDGATCRNIKVIDNSTGDAASYCFQGSVYSGVFERCEYDTGPGKNGVNYPFYGGKHISCSANDADYAGFYVATCINCLATNCYAGYRRCSTFNCVCSSSNIGFFEISYECINCTAVDITWYCFYPRDSYTCIVANCLAVGMRELFRAGTGYVWSYNNAMGESTDGRFAAGDEVQVLVDINPIDLTAPNASEDIFEDYSNGNYNLLPAAKEIFGNALVNDTFTGRIPNDIGTVQAQSGKWPRVHPGMTGGMRG